MVVADLSERPCNLVVDLTVIEERDQHLDGTSITQLAQQVNCIVAIRGDLRSQVARRRFVSQLDRLSCAQHAVGRAIREYANEGNEPAGVAHFCKQIGDVAASVAIRVRQPGLERDEVAACRFFNDSIGHLDLLPKNRLGLVARDELANLHGGPSHRNGRHDCNNADPRPHEVPLLDSRPEFRHSAPPSLWISMLRNTRHAARGSLPGGKLYYMYSLYYDT